MKNYKTIFWKVLLGFGIVVCLLATTYWITYSRLSALKQDMNTLTGVNPKNTYRKLIAGSINDIDYYIKQYAVNRQDSLLVRYDSCMVVLGNYMDGLGKLSLDNEAYAAKLDHLGFYIERKLEICNERIALANKYDSQPGLAEIISKISETQKEQVITQAVPVMSESVAEAKTDKTEAKQKRKTGFFSSLFGGNRGETEQLKKKNVISLAPAEQTITTVKDSVVGKDTVVSASKVKKMLRQVAEKESAKSSGYYKATLTLIEKDAETQDSIRSIFGTLEKLERAESKARLATLTDNTSSNITNILTSIIASGVLIMLVFLIIVYREVKHNNKLRHALMEEKKSTEKLAKAKEEFLANMSHEIRTPMNVIVGFSEQLLKTELASDQQKLLFNIRRSSNHLISIINEILDYSKMESGGIVLEQIPFSVCDILDEVYESFKNTAEKKGLALHFNCAGDVAKKVVGDPVRLKQILLNLVANAIKFTEQGAVTFSVKVASAEAKKQTLQFEVSDTGIGISEENLNTIFDQFTQADSSVTRKFGGTGLGLTISKKLVELQQGTINVTSTPGKGSAFTFTIVYQLPVEGTGISEEATNLLFTNKQQVSGKRVLIVDDDEMNKMLAQHILESYGMLTAVADNGKEAFGKIMQESFDLILMDLHMPEMGGLEVTAMIRKKTITTPVIAVTGNVMKGERDKCIVAGMNDYISKPYDEKELMRKITKLLPMVG